jgi:succinate-semialdehyde dehydrogenase / glutarate-semialdehyde dehydrogenase
MPIATIDPSTGATLKTFAAQSEAEVGRRLEHAATAFSEHRRTSFVERAARMMRAAELLEERSDEYARIMAIEMGKPLQAGRDEARKCARCCRFYADNAERFLADEEVETGAARSFIRYQPLGAVLAIMPWNFPFWQVIRFAAPALMAGNVGLLKHASNVPQCALALEALFADSGFAEGVFQTLLIGSESVDRVIADPRIAAVTLTGSEAAGERVAAAAGRHLKKTVLELGGSDPFVVLPSADLEAAVRVAVKARTVNSGQSCIAAKRFIAHEAIAERFERRMTDEMRSLRVGSPLEEGTQIGPLATAEILSGLDDQVKRTVAAGARLLAGGHRLEGAGNFYAPTVLADIPRDSPGWNEEFFGPVALLFRARSLDEAIALANATDFGLGASVWTNDAAEQARCIHEIEAGQVFINAMVASDPRIPFGGVKRSGYGRELGVLGIREFVNVKTVWIEQRSETCARGTE